MNLFDGLSYNYRGFKLGIKTPSLLFWGLVRFVVMAIITVAAAGLVLTYYHEILSLVWARPESSWIVWLWHLVSWLVALLLVAISSVVAFLVSQLLFSVAIMDVMSRITEKRITGREKEAHQMSWLEHFLNLLRQEIPRMVIPVMIALVLMVLGWLTPLAPVVTVISSLAAGTFLAWDNTDLIPARRLEPFGERFRFLLKNLGFHLGFGLWFLIPGINILFLSFAPVGATLFYVERIDGVTPQV